MAAAEIVRASRRPLVNSLAHGFQRPIALGIPAVWRQVLKPPRHPDVGIRLGECRIRLLVCAGGDAAVDHVERFVRHTGQGTQLADEAQHGTHILGRQHFRH